MWGEFSLVDFFSLHIIYNIDEIFFTISEIWKLSSYLYRRFSNMFYGLHQEMWIVDVKDPFGTY